MPKGYVLVEVEVSNPDLYAEYAPKAAAAIAQHGGRYLVRGGNPEVVEGDRAPKRVVVLEFDSREQAKAFYHSPEYRDAMAIRHRASTAHMTLLDGYEPA